MSSAGRSLRVLTPPAGAPPRLSRAEFPPYSYVPRLTPHPVTDPSGHSFGIREQPIELAGRRLPQDWLEVEEYLLGIDLFNAAFFWEAHESWEVVWHAAGQRSVTGHFLQGLIQGSAALLQLHCRHLQGARNLLARSAGNLDMAREWLAAHHRSDFMGVELDAWEAALAAYASGETPRFPFLSPVAPQVAVSDG